MESVDLFHSNIMDNYYPNRPTILENNCLYEFLANYDYKKNSCPQTIGHSDCLTLKNNFGYIHKRSKTALVKVKNFKY